MLCVFLNLHTPRTPFLAGIKAIDWIGVATIVGGVVMFLLGLESGGVTHPWSSAYTICLIIFGILTLFLFFINEWKFAKYPIMPLHLFNNRSACASFGSCFLHGFVFIAGSYYLPLYFQTVLSATPLLSGVYLFPFALTLSFQSALIGIMIKKTGRYREPIWFGFVFMTLGFGLFIDLDPRPNWAKIVIYQIIAGIGVGPNFQSPLIALQSTIKPQDIATATGTFGFVRQLSTSISVVLGGVVFTNVLANKAPYLASVLPADVVGQLAASSSGSNTQFLKMLPPDQKDIVNIAYTDSLQKMWIFYTAMSALAILVSAFIGKKVLSKTHEQTRTGLEEQERVRVERAEERRSKKDKDTKRSWQCERRSHVVQMMEEKV
jgi:Major Facilitator Superfamily